MKELEKRKNEKVRGVLCAPGISKNALSMPEKSGLEKKQKILEFY